MENSKKETADLFAELCLDPGFVLVPQDRYEELIRAETERDVLEAILSDGTSYSAEKVLDAIKSARSRAYRMKMLTIGTSVTMEDKPDAE